MCRDCVKSDKKRKDNETARHLLRFSGAVSEALLEWVRTHQENPYPNAADKARLQEVTGLDARQLNTWFANYRRRKQAGRSSKDAPNTIPQLSANPVYGRSSIIGFLPSIFSALTILSALQPPSEPAFKQKPRRASLLAREVCSVVAGYDEQAALPWGESK